MKKIVLIVHNVRSAHNVGSILRSANGFGINQVYLTGYSPYPKAKDDERLPHIARRAATQIHKTALGAENSIRWSYSKDTFKLIKDLMKNYQVIALEQTPKAMPLDEFKTSKNTALIVGSEVKGLDPEILDATELHLEIPMFGQKESFNVSVAAAIAMYHLRFGP